MGFCNMKNFFLFPGILLVLLSGFAGFAKECRIGYLSVDLPVDYSKPAVTRYDSSAKLVVGSTPRENRSQSFISITEIYINKYPEKTKENLLKLYPENEIAPFLAKKKVQYDAFSTTEISTQKLGGFKFVKVVWGGNLRGSDVKMRGIYLVARDGDVIYELNYVDYDDYFDLCYKEAMNIFNTLSH